MTSVRELTITSRAQAPGPREQVARVEKPNASSTLRRKAASPAAEQANASRSRRTPRVSRFETDEFAPLWYGPRLRPAFVAQVLGQAFPAANSQRAESSAAYRGEGVPSGLLVDRKI
jgi:hypothetical protein